MPTVPKTERGLWSRVERETGYSVLRELREFCRRRGAVAAVLRAREEDRQEEFSDLCETVRAAVECGIAPGGEPITPTVEGDARWGLWAELDARYRAEAAWPSARTYAPIEINPPQSLQLPGERASMVRVRFDARLSQRALFAALKAAWPGLGEDGSLRRTRPIGDRGIALLRQVCLQDAPGTPWRARLERWNEEQQEKWRYPDVRSFHSAFRRAEKQLTGSRYGLEWHYEALARLTPIELEERAEGGDSRAAARLHRWQERAGAIIAGGAEAIPPFVRAVAEALRAEALKESG